MWGVRTVRVPRSEPTLKVALPYSAALANRALPLVRRIVTDLVGHFRHWEEAVLQVDLTSHHNLMENAAAERWQKEAQRLAAEIEGCVRELSELGIEVRGIDVGLVDFPGTLEGRDVYFCWMLGESAVTHWHEKDTGFSSRQPVPLAVLAEHG
jgi:hypothetical protein